MYILVGLAQHSYIHEGCVHSCWLCIVRKLICLGQLAMNKYCISLLYDRVHVLFPIAQMYTTKLGKDVLEAQNVHKWKPVIFSFFLFILFASRVVYDLTAVIIIVVNDEEMHSYGFGSSWMATDMVKCMSC